VRANAKIMLALWPCEVQIFWPLITHSSPSSSALVWRLATSEPAPGSENIWHHMVLPEMLSARKRSFCSCVPYSASIGMHMPWLMMNSLSGIG